MFRDLFNSASIFIVAILIFIIVIYEVEVFVFRIIRCLDGMFGECCCPVYHSPSPPFSLIMLIVSTTDF